MHALVTGGGGFLGRYIVEQLLARGDRVRSFARGAYPELDAMGVEVVRGNIAEFRDVAAACEGVDCVFHAAAQAGISLCREEYDLVNRAGTEYVVAGCRQHGVPRLVYTGSPSVVFGGEDQCGVDEQAPYDWSWMSQVRAYYSESKARAEEIVLVANGDAMKTCVLRPHLIWGPRDSHLLPRLIARARGGRLRRIGDGANRIDMIYVENAAEAHLLAADALGVARPAAETASPAGKAYFLSQGETVNCWEWIDDVLALVGLPPVKKSVSFRTAWRAGAVCEAVYRALRLKGEPPMTRFLAAQLAKSHWFDISAARRDLGYVPRVSTEEGMRRLGEWLKTTR